MTRDLILTKAIERDKFELSLGDTLDVKASIVLIFITVLGSLGAVVAGALRIPAPIDVVIGFGQFVVIGALIVSGICCVLALYPRVYSVEKMPQEYAKWLDDLSNYYSGSEDKEYVNSRITEAFDSGIFQRASERITANHALNGHKSQYLFVAFWFAASALAIELATLVAVGVAKLPS